MTQAITITLDQPLLRTLTIDKLVALIAKYQPNWQCFYLFNHHAPVIGICPRISFCLQAQTDSQTNKQTNDTCHKPFYLSIEQDDGTQSNRHVDFAEYQSILNQYYQKHQTAHHTHTDQDHPSSFCHHHYHHGLMGYISYDISAQALNANIGVHDCMPLAFFAHYDCYISQSNDKLSLVGFNESKIQHIYAQLSAIHNTTLTPSALRFFARWSKDDYAHAFAQTQAYLKAGDAYQINLTQAWQAFDTNYLYHHLPAIQKTNAPYLGYLFIHDCEILSASPELFYEFCAKSKRTVTTCPIKGTRRRDADPIIDTALKNELANSEKDIAENVMIVDLLRNDLGKYAKIGQVSVPERFGIHSYSNVHHMLSTITAELKDDISVLDVLFDSLPAGSITGSPKKRACEIIHELECQARGAYCGSMGFLNFDETGAFNVLIRTLQSYPTHLKQNQATKHRSIELWAGGGITVLSNCADEYQESMDKIAHLQALLSTPLPKT